MMLTVKGESSIYNKIVMIIFVAAFFYAVIHSVLSKEIIEKSFYKLEEKLAIENVDRLTNSVKREIEVIDNFVLDWAEWDDSYEFIKDKNQNYIDNNLMDATLLNMDLNFMFFIDKEGNIVWEKQINLESGEEYKYFEFNNGSVNVHSDFMLDFNVGEGEAVEHKSGALIIEGKLVHFSSRPILTSKKDKPARGVLMMGRIVDRLALNKISKRLQIEFNIELIKNRTNDTRIKEIYNYLEDKKNYLKRENDTIEVSRIIRDVLGREVILLTVKMPTEISQIGKNAVNMYKLLTLIGLIAMVLLSSFAIKKSVIKPLLKLTNHIRGIGDSEDLSKTLQILKDDEIGMLTREFNYMTKELYKKTEELKKLANIDYLTQMYNRGHIMKILENETDRSVRYKHSISILMLDIDYFRIINDSYGHSVGDVVLRRISSELKVTIRSSDIVGRYGGEEFIVILLEQDLGKSKIVAEKIRKRIEELEWKDNGMKTTISIGIAEYRGQTLEELIDEADKKLYEAKYNGRNRVEG